MNKAFIFAATFLFFSNTTFSMSGPCDPSTDSSCKKFVGEMGGVGVHFKAPAGYFYSRKGVQRGWLLADGSSRGTWRVRIMNWKKMTAGETQNHFHQMAHSDLQAGGPVQEIVSDVGEGFYQHQIECEDDCTKKSFVYYIQVP